MSHFKIRWQEVITKEAIIEAPDGVDPEHDDNNLLDSILADVADEDCTEYDVTEREWLEYEEVD